MGRIPWNEIQAPDGGLPGALGDLADAAVNTWCEFYRDARPWLGIADGISFGTANAMGDAVYDRVCTPTNPPLPPAQSPIQGGQCCESYLYDLEVSHPEIGGTETYADFGKIGGLRAVVVSEDDVASFGYWEWEVGSDCPNTSPEIIQRGWQVNLPRPSAAITNIRRADGLPDECGDRFPVPVYPMPPASAPPNPNINITANIGGVSVNLIGVINNVQVSPEFNFTPEFNIELGGLNFNFTLDGLDITIAPGLGGDTIPPRIPLPPGSPEPPIVPPRAPENRRPPSGGGGGGGGDCPDVDLSPVLREISEVQSTLGIVAGNIELLLDCDRCDRPRPEECTRLLIGTGQGGVFQLAEGAVWIEVDIVSTPQYPDGYLNPSSPNVLMCGWHEFGGNGASGVRTQIQYYRNIFPVIEGSSSFSFGLRTGYSANCYAYLEPN